MVAGKYGGMFRNFLDGIVCMRNYSYQCESTDFLISDDVILVVRTHRQRSGEYTGIPSRRGQNGALYLYKIQGLPPVEKRLICSLAGQNEQSGNISS